MAEKKMIIKFVVDNFEEATKDIEDVFNVLLNFNEDGFWESGCTPAFFNKLLGTLCKPRPHLRKAIITSICKTSATTFPGGKIGLKRDGIILRFWDHILAGEFDSLSDKVLVEQCKDHCLMHFGLKPKDGIEIEAEAYEDSDFESVSPKKLAVKSASKLDSSSSVSSAVECDQCDGTPIKSKVPSGDISGDDDVSQYIDDDFERSSPVSDKNASSGRSKVDARSSLLSDDSIGQYLDDDFEMDSSTKPTNSKVNPLDSTHSGSSNYGNDEFEVDTANPSQLDVSVYSVDGPPISNRLSKPKSAQVPFIEEMQEMNGMTANELAEYIVDSSGNYQSNPSLSISKSKGVRSGSVEPSEEDEDSEMETTMKSFMNKHNINAFTPSNVVTPIVPSGGRTPKEESVVTPSEECESDDKQSEVKDVDAKDTSVIFHDSEPEAYANEIDELNGFEQGGIRPCSGKDVVEVSATAHPSTVNAYPVASSSHTDKPVVAPENNRKIIESPVRLYDRPKGNSSTKRYTSNKAISKSAASSNVRVSAGGAGKSTSDKGEIVTHPTGNEYKSPSPAMWAQLQRERTQARQQFISVDSVSRNKEKSVFSDYNEMNNVLLSHVLYYSNLLKTIIKEAYDMWQKRLRESLKRGLEDLNSKYMEQMEILSQCPDYLPVKNNPILNAFSHPGTTQSRRLFTGDTVKKCLLEERANEIHMQSLEDMRNSIRMPLVKLKKSYREHQNKLNDIIRRCQDIHKAGILVFRRYNLNQCMEFVMGGKVKKGLNQTESVCRASVTNMAFQCQELKNLFTISGLHMYGAMCCSLRDICATAALEITIHNSSSYPLPKILCSDVTKAHVTAKVNSRTTLKQLQRPKSSSPLGVKRSKMMRPFSAPNGNAATQLQSHNRTSSCNGGGNMQARNRKCVGDADDEENGYEDEFEDMSDTIKDVNVKQEEAINAHHVQPLNYQDVDDTIPEDDGSGDEYDLEMEQKPHRSSSPVRMKSAAYNRSRPVSAKRLSEMKLQALPPVMYNTELDAGIVVQWHPLPCPQCCKFFRGEGFELPTHFSVDKDMVHFVHNKSYDLKSSANLTMQEAMQLESVRQRPTSAYKRLSHALSSTRKDQLAQKLNVLSLGAHRMASATMKTEKQSNSKTHLQEFCSWVCMKRWCRSHFNLQRRYETELLIDLTAGCVVDAD